MVMKKIFVAVSLLLIATLSIKAQEIPFEYTNYVEVEASQWAYRTFYSQLKCRYLYYLL